MQVRALGFTVEDHDRFKLGIVERLGRTQATSGRRAGG